MRGEGLWVAQAGVAAEERQPADRVGGFELLQHQPAEELREPAHWHEEARLACDPLGAVERDSATGHDHVDVRMRGHRRAPGVEHGGDADPAQSARGLARISASAGWTQRSGNSWWQPIWSKCVWLATQTSGRPVTRGTWQLRLKWPRPVSKSRSRSRPRTCQMLQRKKGLIHGSWIRVTSSAMRIVSYSRARRPGGDRPWLTPRAG
jgi:hypothetical protein